MAASALQLLDAFGCFSFFDKSLVIFSSKELAALVLGCFSPLHLWEDQESASFTHALNFCVL